jgi:hypothetical protein
MKGRIRKQVEFLTLVDCDGKPQIQETTQARTTRRKRVDRINVKCVPFLVSCVPSWFVGGFRSEPPVVGVNKYSGKSTEMLPPANELPPHSALPSRTNVPL